MSSIHEPIVITSDCCRGRASRRVAWIVVWLIVAFLAVFFVLILFTPAVTADHSSRLDFLLMLASCAAGVFWIPFSFPRGTWTISEDGVRFDSLFGTTSILRWDEIERVTWERLVVGLRAGKTIIQFCWQQIDPEDTERAMRNLEERLSPQFDLSPYDRPRLFEPGIWNSLKWFARMIAISLTLTTVSFGGAMAIGFATSFAEWARPMEMMALFSPWLLLIPVALHERSRFPRWRKRRSIDRAPSGS